MTATRPRRAGDQRTNAGLLIGIGVGWRPEIAGVVAGLPGLGFCEVVAESVPARRDRLPEPLRDLLARGVPVVPHGVSLSLGGTDPVDADRVRHLASCADALDSPLVSEHIAFVRAGGLEAGHLLPLPRTREAVDAIVRNILRVQAESPVPLALEPIAALFEWPEDELTEGQFVTEILDRTGALLVLDVANVHANALNSGRDAARELASFPLERIAYCHVAGGSVRDGIYHDTHTDPVPSEVLALVAEVASSRPGAPFLLERDGAYPPAAELRAELDAIADAAGQERVT